MSQEHNALSWPGLEPRSSDLEPSALTTGPPDKAMALACLWYSWPHMLKVASCMVVRSYGRTAVWAYGRTTKFFWLDGLLLFCIIMGLHSASSAINHIFSCEWIRNLQNDPHKKLRLKKKHKKKKSGMDRVQTIMWQAQVESLSKPGEGFFPNNYLDCSLTL